MAEDVSQSVGSLGLSRWLGSLQNRLFSSLRFQDIASRLPFLSRVSRKEGEAIFQLMSGFVDTQVLLSFVRLGILDDVAEAPQSLSSLAKRASIEPDKMELLCRAGQAIGLVRIKRGRVHIARRGLLVRSLPGIADLIDHHTVLYQDLADPVALLRGQSDPDLARFWPYVFGAGQELDADQVARYSGLMAKSQYMVARDTLAVLDVVNGSTWLDVGGGSGAFLSEVVRKHPTVKASIFDLAGAKSPKSSFGFHAGSFFEDDLPTGFDVISLIRVLYDHQDQTVDDLLAKVYSALPSGGRIIISEPMLGHPKPNRFGDTYFAFYTLAMKTGKTRSPTQISDLLTKNGFEHIKIHKSSRPFVTQVIQAQKS